jgi:signal transduction histidine kinase
MTRSVVNKGALAPARRPAARGAFSGSQWTRLPLSAKILLPMFAMTFATALGVAAFFTSAEVDKDRLTQAAEGKAIALFVRGALVAVPDDPSTLAAFLHSVNVAYTNVASLCVLTVNPNDPLGPLRVYASAGPPAACDSGSPLVPGLGAAGVASGPRQTAAGYVEESTVTAAFSGVGQAAVVEVQVRLTPVVQVALPVFEKTASTAFALGLAQTAAVFGILWISALRPLRRLGLKASAAAHEARPSNLEGKDAPNRSRDEVDNLSERVDEMLGAVRDRELALVESHDKLQTLISNSPVIVFSTDAEGNILQIQGNDVRGMARGLGKTTLAGMNLLQVVHLNPVFTDVVQRALAGEKVHELVAVRNWMDSAATRPAHLDLFMTPTRDTEGRVTGTTGLAVNVSDRIDAVTARAESQQKSAFLAAMSHELRTPLNSIMGFSQLLEMPQGKAALTAKQRRYVEHIYTSGEHLLALVSNILDLAKVGAGQMEVNIEAVAIHDEVKDPIEKMRPLAVEKGLTIKLDIPLELTSHTDRLRVRQILYNLLTNAVKFTPRDGGPITVTGRRDGAGIEIVVKDAGIGIALQDQARIFEEFTQLDRGPSRRLDGTGLGLTLTRKMVELLGGTIRVESALGRGSTFTVWLPGAVAESESPAPAAPEAA